eukprot:CAMPEP_0202969196 /NCGR_PEP_ID=MMETSP1396-20130829/14832_1 /ASSEMBLY_ACC=CAM_ASM_000872 /TAXON_ID= /ORGANISM="Pseudokeronopsis sp., Strain Brazil" /LENGTH=47 /DNA_ID= /DNA_START= /DNA_END= /DNA_ORIENTATION=
MSPFNTLALAEYETDKQAQIALKNLAYYEVKHVMPMYLEMAPKGIFE